MKVNEAERTSPSPSGKTTERGEPAMTPNQETIDRFRKMATDDPTNELAHYRLGGLLMEAGQFPDAIESFRRTLELSPQFSKVYQLLGQCYLAAGERKLAADTWTAGYKVADERGDLM